MTLRTIFATAWLGAALAAQTAAADTWHLDPVHSSIGFSVRHMVVSKINGTFDEFEGAIEFDPEHPGRCSVEVTIDARSVNTRNAKRDADIQKEGFLDTARFPTITFRSRRVSRDGDTWKADGDLTIHGVTRPVTLVFRIQGPVRDPWGNDRIGIEVDDLRIDRQQFGLSFNRALETGGLVVGNEVTIHIQAEAVRARPHEAK